MHKKPVITIARQFGSGGHQIGRRVAELLEIPVYDKELILLAAEKSGYHPDVLSKADEKVAGSLLYTLAVGASPKTQKCFRICSSAPFSRRETCACDMPISAAISICVLPLKKRISMIFRSLSLSALSASPSEISSRSASSVEERSLS